ncbi:uncharacterized protein N7496_005599 [Penicillium cataractarum]|uniref:Uncharacterized protein n=1 Tax=Penicillium cataractarum TaxID=2100454 RepID=A0A9W9VG20_9EURO|nr:uncharacterized protein N7496_005599 [Penicillium cataractarum]KAJ5378190.1 hypothetical protein N7496_005599 [Penicillium cataractarum]
MLDNLQSARDKVGNALGRAEILCRIKKTKKISELDKDVKPYVPNLNGPVYRRKLIGMDGPRPYYVSELKYSHDDKPVTLREWELSGRECYERKALVDDANSKRKLGV